MKENFFKFPSTRHLAFLGDVNVREDKIMSESERDKFLQHELVIEEKIDGANIGISFDIEGNIRAQNRGGYLYSPYTGQWKKLAEWLDLRADLLFDQLSDRYILFGEWCYAKHSLTYDRLPDLFIGFDIFDKFEMKFFSYLRRTDVFRTLNIAQVPMIERGYYSISKIKDLLSSQSQFSNEPVEGIYLRIDQGGWLKDRAKLVRSEFVQSIEQHWTQSGIKANRLKSENRMHGL